MQPNLRSVRPAGFETEKRNHTPLLVIVCEDSFCSRLRTFSQHSEIMLLPVMALGKRCGYGQGAIYARWP